MDVKICSVNDIANMVSLFQMKMDVIIVNVVRVKLAQHFEFLVKTMETFVKVRVVFADSLKMVNNTVVQDNLNKT